MSFAPISIGVMSIVGISVSCYRYYKKTTVTYHPTLEYVMMMLKFDNRVSNFCGSNYRTSKHYMISNTDSEVIYRFKVEGMRGLCKVVVKARKLSHEDLISQSSEQTTFSKKSKEEKAISGFITVNYNDVIIPSNETNSKIKEMLVSQNIKDQDFLQFKRENYLAGIYHSDKSDFIKSLRKPIDNSDTFYRISAITMVADDKYVFNIRPINANYRDYDIEDTTYQYKTYDDIIKKVMNQKFEYNELLKEDISAEDFKNEMILYKQMKFQQRMDQRKYTIFTSLAVGFVYFAYNSYVNRHKIDVATLKSLQSKIMNLSSKTPLGNTKRLICIDYYYVAGSDRFRVRGLAMGEKGAKVGIDTTSIIDDSCPHQSVLMYSLASTNRDKSKDIKISN